MNFKDNIHQIIEGYSGKYLSKKLSENLLSDILVALKKDDKNEGQTTQTIDQNGSVVSHAKKDKKKRTNKVVFAVPSTRYNPNRGPDDQPDMDYIEY